MQELFKMAEQYCETMVPVLALDIDGNPAPQLLIQVSTTTFMCAFHLAFSGHTAAVHATTRAALEAALFGYVVSRGDEHFDRWTNPPRDFKKKVHASEAFRLLEKEGIEEHRELKASYEDLIARGAHPNRLAVARHTRSTPNEGGEELEFTAIYPPSKNSLVHIAHVIGTAAMSMVVGGATLTGSRERLFREGRSLYKRLLTFLEANAAPSSPLPAGATSSN
ncbi:hypothetical protein FOC84_26620 [Achromobacter pestifer]|uniref:Uncharacterized protein n=1 Tax=Achromobacter pestifer TaxID=1353889 RepID=A0A7D4HTX8_9BURK|nr:MULTISPECIES: hypothetical protein [Achromobacter]QKH38317.1 hypothetical protein FOC84_26620 [Achromobacter pestifer]